MATERRSAGRGPGKRQYVIRDLRSGREPVGPGPRAAAAPAPAPPGKSRNEMIAEAAYYRAQRRGFAPGDAVRDWLEAEREIDARFQEEVR